MAKKSSRSGSKKHYPVQRTLLMGEVSPTSNNPTMVVRTDYALSQVNHRLYRQSRIPSVKVSGDLDAPPGGYLDVYAISDTWINQKAYQLAKEQFDENAIEEMEQVGESNRARWNDFRVDIGLSSFAEMYPVLQGTVATNLGNNGEYLMSEVTDASGTSRTFRWIGTGSNTFNIIDEYDVTGRTSSTPSAGTSTAAYEVLHDDIEGGMIDHISNDGNLPPYAENNLENECFSRVARLTVTAAGETGKVSTAFFNAPAGFILLVGGGGWTSTTLNEKIQVEVKSGDYKGIHAPSYLE